MIPIRPTLPTTKADRLRLPPSWVKRSVCVINRRRASSPAARILAKRMEALLGQPEQDLLMPEDVVHVLSSAKLHWEFLMEKRAK
jgi:hypothetical protein